MPRILSSPSARKRKKKMETRKVTEEGGKKEGKWKCRRYEEGRKIKAFLAREKMTGYVYTYIYARTYACIFEIHGERLSYTPNWDNICIFICKVRFHALRGMTWGSFAAIPANVRESETMRAFMDVGRSSSPSTSSSSPSSCVQKKFPSENRTELFWRPLRFF